MAINKDSKKIEEILTRSIDTIYPDKKSFEKMLKSGKQLKIYMGIDPTATYAHIGHATNYMILKRLHDLGHKIIVLVGDFTAMIGDPSDKGAARKRLTKEEIQKNLKTYKKQISKILDFNDKKNLIDFRFNSEWLGKLNFSDIVDLASQFTVQRMMERDIFERRVKENKPLYVHEFLYPLMQGYDSVALEADVEIGGTDQTFNMLAGRSLVKTYQNREKIVVTTTLLENPVTGEKLMSKSLGTGIGLDESAGNMYGKTMALPDEAIIQVFIDCTWLPMEKIGEYEAQLKSGQANPRNLKAQLAWELVKLYHGKKEADQAGAEFDKVFKKKGKPDEIKEVKVKASVLVDALAESKLTSSKSEARRVILSGGVKVDDKVVKEPMSKIKKGDVIQKGKRHFRKIK